MEVLGALALFAVIVAIGAWVSERVSRGARQHIPARTRQRASNSARAAGESVRAIRARAWSDVKARNWLERKQAARARKAAAPPRPARAGPAIRTTGRTAGRGLAATGRGIGRGIRTVVRPRTTEHVPGVTDRPRLQSVPATVPVSDPASKSAPQNPERPATMASTRSSVPPDFAALVARIAQFEPESDGELIQFLRGIASGTAAIGDALEQHADHLSNGVGLDAAATAAITESAQAYAEAAQAVSRADARFQAVYAGVRETAAGGTVLPFRGRWITGESA